MGNRELLIGIPVVLLNGLGFFIMGYDKLKAKTGSWRIQERSLLLIAFAGGAIGVFLGMKVFHHKTRHLSFTIGLPLLVVINLIMLVLLYYLLLYTC